MLAELRAVKPTEQLLLPAERVQIIEPARIVQSQAAREVQPASYSDLRGRATIDQRHAGVRGERLDERTLRGRDAMTKRLFAVSMPP